MGILDLFKPNVEKMEAEKDIKGLIKSLKYKRKDQFLESAGAHERIEALVRIGKPAVEPLIHALNDENWRIRSRVAEALGGIKDPRALVPLWKAVKNDEYSYEAQHGWLPSDDDYWETFYPVRAAAKNAREKVEMLIERGDAEVVEPLIHALNDEDSYLRLYATEALGKIKDVRAVEALIHALNDEESYVRESAAETLIRIGEPAVEPLIHALNDEDIDVRRRAALALGEIKDVRAVEPLIHASKDMDWRVSGEALVKIGDWRAGDKRAIELFSHALKDEDRRVRLEVIDALVKMGDKMPIEPLIWALNDEDSYVQYKAVKALGKIKDVRAVEPLIHALKAVNIPVRKKAAETLIRIGDMHAQKAAKEAMDEIKESKNRNIRVDAVKSFNSITAEYITERTSPFDPSKRYAIEVSNKLKFTPRQVEISSKVISLKSGLTKVENLAIRNSEIEQIIVSRPNIIPPAEEILFVPTESLKMQRGEAYEIIIRTRGESQKYGYVKYATKEELEQYIKMMRELLPVTAED
ncbi:MAG: HEAT repeat domain-containing protein [Proteobacteria bacterium]|nr:HEAT repeat domain-containing protein [Pseudomonadota bacterium]